MAEGVDLEFGIGDGGEIISGKAEYPVPFLRFKDYFSILLQGGYYKRCIESDDNDYVSDGAMDTTLFCNDRYADIMICKETGSVALFDFETRHYFLYNGLGSIVQCGDVNCNLHKLDGGEPVFEKGNEYFEGRGFIYLGEKVGYLLYGGMVINSNNYYTGEDAMSMIEEYVTEPTSLEKVRGFFEGNSCCNDLETYTENEKYSRYRMFLRYVSSKVNSCLMSGQSLSDVDKFLASVVLKNGIDNGHLDVSIGILSEDFIRYCNYAIVRSDYSI